jgi:hypothetical protein
MKKNRSTSELLKLLHDSINEISDKEFKYGLCHHCEKLLDNGIINSKEAFLLKLYIDKNRPNNNYGAWSWPSDLKRPRLLWLRRQIKKQKSKLMKKDVIILINPGHFPECWDNLKILCEAKGWEYNILSKMKVSPIDHEGFYIYRVPFHCAVSLIG